MSTNQIDNLLASYCRSLKDFTEAVVRQADEGDVQALARAVLDVAAAFSDEMFSLYGVIAPVEREWPDEDEDSDDAPDPGGEVMVARVRFLFRGSITDEAFRALDAYAEGWVAIAGDLGLEIEEFDVRVEPVDDINWD